MPRLPSAVAAMLTTEFIAFHRRQRGFTLVELIVFIVVISLALGAMLAVYQQSVVSSVDPIKRIRMLELAQAQLDRVMALRYAEETPMGGIPACSSCTNNIDGLDDVDDYDTYTDTRDGYSRSVEVTEASYFGATAKEISVIVTAPDGESLTLSSYRYNF